MAYRRKARRPARTARPARSRSGYRSGARVSRSRVRSARGGGTIRIELVQPGANAVARPFNMSTNAPADKPKGSKF